MAGNRDQMPTIAPHPPVLVIGLVNRPSNNRFWVWELLDRVEPQLKEMIDVGDQPLSMPEFRRATARRHRLTEALPVRERVVLVTAAEPSEMRSDITHWHCGGDPLRTVRQTAPSEPVPDPPMEPFWLEDQISPGGMDLVRVPSAPAGWARQRAAHARMRVIASGLLGTLWEIVREVSELVETSRHVA